MQDHIECRYAVCHDEKKERICVFRFANLGQVAYFPACHEFCEVLSLVMMWLLAHEEARCHDSKSVLSLVARARDRCAGGPGSRRHEVRCTYNTRISGSPSSRSYHRKSSSLFQREDVVALSRTPGSHHAPYNLRFTEIEISLIQMKQVLKAGATVPPIAAALMHRQPGDRILATQYRVRPLLVLPSTCCCDLSGQTPSAIRPLLSPWIEDQSLLYHRSRGPKVVTKRVSLSEWCALDSPLSSNSATAEPEQTASTVPARYI